MDFLILGVLVLGFLVNILVTRFLMKRVADKINFLSSNSQEVAIPSTPLNPAPNPSGKGFPFLSPVDKPAPNQMNEDDNDVEFNEQNFSNLPDNVKLIVEGGDTHVPPGFEEAKKA